MLSSSVFTPPVSPRRLAACGGFLFLALFAPLGESCVTVLLAVYVVIRSELIETLNEARSYYAERLAGAHKVTCYGRPVTIVFERDATHLYSIDPKGVPIPDGDRVERIIPRHRIEVRLFNVERARLMDHVLRAVSLFSVSVPDAGGRAGHQKRVVYGPALATTEHMRVVLRPGPGEAWTCVSAYPVTNREWLAARSLKRAKFPP